MLRQTLRQSLSQRLCEPSGYARGGGSPKVEGKPLEIYRSIAPVKIELVHPADLTYTDSPVSHTTFHGVQKQWEKTILDAADKSTWNFPLICPIVIDNDRDIIDGNHRATAAGIHTNQIPAILVEDDKDIAAIQSLVAAGIFYWPHGMVSYEGLMKKKDMYADSDMLYECVANFEEDQSQEFGNEREGIYFNPNPFSTSSLEYLVSRVIHQKMYAKETRNFITEDISLFKSFIRHPEKTLEQELKEGLYERIKKIAESNPLVSKEGVKGSDDIAQEVLLAMSRIHKLAVIYEPEEE